MTPVKKTITAAAFVVIALTGALATASPAAAETYGGECGSSYSGDYFTSYAGPIYLAAADRCVDWMGRISGTEGGKRATNCD
ncbi:hypothetical protein OG884_35245 [Streptosporangium sp. NBC_01755]|uniref:hypothetical protein n=1 Tax=unclassified Streptosporangium TaxID=2632669 RepID=UPI002DD8C173|nr:MULTISPECIES: hypothetical protein [unclassified Streptosporangium]WSA28537.1 hypothetical protein OIE13_12020 [Streptosporangium sp. NBC_01810]WSC99974.1 hypothetical protein OG884_35245 [Streptosporangium sp. NBC_01755]